jgi:hypothetical protein
VPTTTRKRRSIDELPQWTGNADRCRISPVDSAED